MGGDGQAVRRPERLRANFFAHQAVRLSWRGWSWRRLHAFAQLLRSRALGT